MSLIKPVYMPTHYALYRVENLVFGTHKRLVGLFTNELPEELYLHKDYVVEEVFDESPEVHQDSVHKSSLTVSGNDAGYVYSNSEDLTSKFFSIIENKFIV